MNNYRKQYKQMKVINLVLMGLIIVCLGIIVFLLMRDPVQGVQPDLPGETTTGTEPAAETTGSSQNSTDTSEPGETGSSEATAAPTENGDMVWIQTPYMTLGYPAEWESYLRYEPKEENGVFTQSFYCAVGEKEIPLFDVHFGSEDAGQKMGLLLTDEGEIPVSMTFHDFIPDETWTDDETYVLYAMQESVNDLIQTMWANGNFVRE